MRRPLAGLAVILLGLGGVVHHTGAQPSTTVPPPAPPAQATRVHGTLPALAGRWLAVTTVGVPAGPRRASASLWEVTRDGAGRLTLAERHVVLPEAERRNVERPDWSPSPAEVAAVAAQWDTYPTEARAVSQIDHEIFGPDGFTDEVRREPMTADARWVVRQTYVFAPARARPVKEVRLFAAEQEEPAGWRGDFLAVTIALAPLPLPIQIPGAFRLIRLDAARPSLWARIAGVLRGCGRGGG